MIEHVFNGHPVRIIEQDGEPWFVAKDVADLLGYARPADAVRKHCKGVSETATPTAGGTQLIKIIPERDVYRLVMRSKLPEAEKFEEWVVSEVLPSIRKRGGYMLTRPEETNEEILARALSIMNESLAKKDKIVAELTQTVEVMEPKANFYDHIVDTESLTVNEAAKRLGTGHHRLMAHLREIGWISPYNNEPYQKYIDAGLLSAKYGTPYNHPFYGELIKVTCLVTGKGLVKLRELNAAQEANRNWVKPEKSKYQPRIRRAVNA